MTLQGRLGVSLYPRVGGGNLQDFVRLMNEVGLSPRGRGKQDPLKPEPTPGGSIPAWAGETTQAFYGAGRVKVYPRVGGGNIHMRLKSALRDGLSPRGRGKRGTTNLSTTQARSIPAWAGETKYERPIAYLLEVYPRVGGGNNTDCYTLCQYRGLSPRGRGKRKKRLVS